MVKWPYKVMWNQWGKYERVQSFKTLEEAHFFMDTHDYPGMKLYIRNDLVRKLV